MENYSSNNRFRSAIFNHGEYQCNGCFNPVVLLRCRDLVLCQDLAELRGHVAFYYWIIAAYVTVRTLRIVPFNTGQATILQLCKLGTSSVPRHRIFFGSNLGCVLSNQFYWAKMSFIVEMWYYNICLSGCTMSSDEVQLWPLIRVSNIHLLIQPLTLSFSQTHLMWWLGDEVTPKL